MLTSAKCGVCGIHYGAWTLNVHFVRIGWNQEVRKKRFIDVESDGFRLIPRVRWSMMRGSDRETYVDEVYVRREPRSNRILFRHPDKQDPFVIEQLTSGLAISAFVMTAPFRYDQILLARPIAVWSSQQTPGLPPLTNTISLYAQSGKWEDQVTKLGEYLGV